MHKNWWLFLAFALSFLNAEGRNVISLNFGWEFEDNMGNRKYVDLPHDFQIEQGWVAPSLDERSNLSDAAANIKSRLSSRGFKEMGQGIYRRQLLIPDSLRGQRILIDFEGIMLVGDVYLNGERIGGTDYGYLGFESNITDKVYFDKPNELMVVADTGEPQNSRWYTGGGLYRNVNLLTTSTDLYFNRHGLQVLTPQVLKTAAHVNIVGDINAKIKDKFFIAEIEISDPQDSVVYYSIDTVAILPKWKNREYQLSSFDIENPRLWNCETPHLYKARIKLRRPDGSIADELNQTFGIRTIEYSPDFGFKLNGEKILLKGIANHHTLGALGAAAYPRAIEKRLKLLKEFGFNHIRTSHNPYSVDFMNLCDKYGILVVDELYDKWLTQYAGGRKEWSEMWQNDIPEWIKRDRNHPSVIMWSLGNELQGYSNLPFNDWGVTSYNLQKTLLRRYDSTRPVTVAMHPRVRSLYTDSIPAPLALETDIASYNYRYMYFPGDAKRYPNLIFYQSEANLSNMGPNFFVPDRDKVVGLAYWGMIDYLGESLGWPAKGWTDGVFDISLQPKPNAWMLKSMFVEDPVVKIGIINSDARLVDWNGIKIGGEIVSDNWNLTEGDTVNIVVYTNADEVSLVLNDKELGRQQNPLTDSTHRNKLMWENVVFEVGSLKAIAYNNGDIVCADSLETTNRPFRLEITADNDSWKADGMDLQHLRIIAVDEKGRKCQVSDIDVKFEVSGPALLIAVGNGDNTSEELNIQNHRRLYQGSALAILRSKQTSGIITFKASAEGLYPCIVSLATVSD